MFSDVGKEKAIMELSTFLNSEGWVANEELAVEIEYQGKRHFASVTEYCQGDAPLYLATLKDGKELLLVTHSLHPDKGTVNWLPVDISNLELANLIGEGIERCSR